MENKNNQNKKIYAGIAGGVIVLLIAVLFLSGILGGKDAKEGRGSSQANLTTSEDTTQPGNQSDSKQKNKKNGKKGSSSQDDPANQAAPQQAPDIDSSEDEYTDYTDEYIFPYSNSKYLKKADVKDLPVSTLSLAKDELYARYGMMFDNINIQEHFEQCGWYTPIYSAKEWSEYGDSYFFNKYEKKNRDFLEKWITKQSKQEKK